MSRIENISVTQSNLRLAVSVNMRLKGPFDKLMVKLLKLNRKAIYYNLNKTKVFSYEDVNK